MKKCLSLVLILSLSSSLVACSSVGTSSSTDSSKALIGMFSGAILGGLAGSAIAEKGGGRLTAIGIGALVGGMAGGSIGMIMDEKDRLDAQPKRCRPHSVIQRAETKSNSWQHTTTTAAAALETPASVAEQPAKTAQRTTPSSSIETATASQPEALKPSVNDKLKNLWNSLPSTQWFFDDGKQVG